MAITKHMTNGDLLRIRKFMAEGITDVGVIQQSVLIHSDRIQQVIDCGLDGPAKAQAAATAKDKLELAEAKVRMAKEEAAKVEAESAPIVKAAAAAPVKAKKPTAKEKAKAKAAEKVDPVS